MQQRMFSNRTSRHILSTISVLIRWISSFSYFFHYLLIGNEPIPVWREIGMGFSRMSGEATHAGKKNSSWITNGTLPIFHEWLSRRDEVKIPHEWRSREWGIFISSQLLSQEWKIDNVPWVMNEEFYPSLFLSRPELTFQYKKGKFQH